LHIFCLVRAEWCERWDVLNACWSSAWKMRLQNLGSGMCEAPERTGSGVMGQGLVWSLAESIWNCLSCRSCCGWNFWVTSCWFYALLCSTNVKKSVEFYAYFLFCTDFNSVDCLGMMLCNGHRPGQGKQALYINVT